MLPKDTRENFKITASNNRGQAIKNPQTPEEDSIRIGIFCIVYDTPMGTSTGVDARIFKIVKAEGTLIEMRHLRRIE